MNSIGVKLSIVFIGVFVLVEIISVEALKSSDLNYLNRIEKNVRRRSVPQVGSCLKKVAKLLPVQAIMNIVGLIPFVGEHIRKFVEKGVNKIIAFVFTPICKKFDSFIKIFN